MSLILRVLDNSVGQKAVAAATGIGLIGFVVVHMVGNLQVFVGEGALNAYAVKLKSLGPLLWIARLGLLALIVLHIAMTIRLAMVNRKRRGSRYAVDAHQASTRSSRTMAISGIVILTFILFHLSHFTFGWIQPELFALKDEAGRHNVYAMVTQGFQNLFITSFYLVAMCFLTAHLSHALFSSLRSLGVNVGGKDDQWKRIAQWTAVVTVAGFAIVPLAAWIGWFASA